MCTKWQTFNWKKWKILARTIFTGKNYFCRQKLFLPVRFLPRKIPVFSTNWQKLANPDHKPTHLLSLTSNSSYPLQSTTCFHVLFGLPQGLTPSTTKSIHFFTHTLSSFLNTWPYHLNLLYCKFLQYCHNILQSQPIFHFLTCYFIR